MEGRAAEAESATAAVEALATASQEALLAAAAQAAAAQEAAAAVTEKIKAHAEAQPVSLLFFVVRVTVPQKTTHK